MARTTDNGYFALSIVERPTVWLAVVAVACQVIEEVLQPVISLEEPVHPH